MLSDKLFIVEGRIEERPILLDDGSTEVLWFKHLPNTAFERYALWRNSADEDVVVTASARLIAMGLCEPDGKPAITEERAFLLKRPVMQRIFLAVMDVNGYGRKDAAVEAGNGLPPGEKTGSSTS